MDDCTVIAAGRYVSSSAKIGVRVKEKGNRLVYDQVLTCKGGAATEL